VAELLPRAGFGRAPTCRAACPHFGVHRLGRCTRAPAQAFGGHRTDRRPRPTSPASQRRVVGVLEVKPKHAPWAACAPLPRRGRSAEGLREHRRFLLPTTWNVGRCVAEFPVLREANGGYLVSFFSLCVGCAEVLHRSPPMSGARPPPHGLLYLDSFRVLHGAAVVSKPAGRRTSGQGGDNKASPGE